MPDKEATLGTISSGLAVVISSVKRIERTALPAVEAEAKAAKEETIRISTMLEGHERRLDVSETKIGEIDAIKTDVAGLVKWRWALAGSCTGLLILVISVALSFRSELTATTTTVGHNAKAFSAVNTELKNLRDKTSKDVTKRNAWEQKTSQTIREVASQVATRNVPVLVSDRYCSASPTRRRRIASELGLRRLPSCAGR